MRHRCGYQGVRVWMWVGFLCLFFFVPILSFLCLFCVFFLAFKGTAIGQKQRQQHQKMKKWSDLCLSTTSLALSCVEHGANAPRDPDLARTIAHVPPPCHAEAHLPPAIPCAGYPEGHTSTRNHRQEEKSTVQSHLQTR